MLLERRLLLLERRLHHDHWNAGIAKTLKWMKDRAKCPTRDVLLLQLQKDAANAAKP